MTARNIRHEMTNQRAGRFVVVAPGAPNRKRAMWWVRCDRCGAQTQHRGTSIRKAQKRDDYLLKCGECGL